MPAVVPAGDPRITRAGGAVAMSDDPRPTALVALRDAAEAGILRARLEGRDLRVIWCASLPLVLRELDAQRRVAVVVVEQRFGDAGAHDVLLALEGREPLPYVAVVADPDAPASDAFALARAGARAFLERPVSDAALAGALRASLPPPPLDPVVRAYVGRVDLAEVQRRVRRAALRQALALADGSRSGAAKLLRVTRQAVQHMIREDVERPIDGADAPVNQDLDEVPSSDRGGEPREHH